MLSDAICITQHRKDKEGFERSKVLSNSGSFVYPGIALRYVAANAH